MINFENMENSLSLTKQNNQNTGKNKILTYLQNNKLITLIFAPIFLAVLFSLLSFSQVFAHAPGQSYLFFKIHNQKIEVRTEITFKDLNRALKTDFPTDRQPTAEEIEPHLEQVDKYIKEKLIISDGTNQEKYNLKYLDYGTLKTKFGRFLLMDYQVVDNLAKIPEKLDVNYTVMFDVNSKHEHRNLVVVEHNWKTGTFKNESSVSLILTPTNPQKSLDLSSSSLLKGFLSVFKLGVLHIWKGYDHLFFLVALILPAVLKRDEKGWQPVQNFRSAFFQVIKIATIFTIAHSLTLALASFQIIQIPSRIVGSIIALSIALAAIDIIYPLFGKRIWWIIFGFGLFHGLGFANVVTRLGVVQDNPLLSLFAFNLGIELGQIAVIAIVLPILYLLRNFKLYRQFFIKSGAVFFFIVAMYWLIENVFNVNFSAIKLVKSVLPI